MKSPVQPNHTESVSEKNISQNDSFFQTQNQAAETFFFSPVKIQPKLEIGNQDDQFRQRAGRVADAVIQRKCAHCEEEEHVQKKRNGSNSSENKTNSELSSRLQANRGLGQPLSASVQSEMNLKIGADFGGVNIHTGTDAIGMNKSLGARAFTHGKDIYFNTGEYNPATTKGKHLLAHELTHTIQQGRSPTHQQNIQRVPLPADPIHDPILDQFSSETGIPRDQASQHSPEYREWLRNSAQTHHTAASIGESCDRDAVIDTIQQSLRWLDDAYQQLIEYEADEVFRDLIIPGGDHARIAGALQQAFNTTNLMYVQVIRRRLLHLANVLREEGVISISCSGQYCGSGGSSATAAYVAGPYALTMCGVGVSGRRPVSTFIHELVHAVIPTIGISNDVSTGDRVTDRAYESERVYEHLSPEETLDNADSYAILAELLHARTNTQIVTGQGDTAQDCRQPNDVLEAFARADQWHHFALHELDVALSYLGGRALSQLPQGNLDMLNRAFPWITSTSELRDLRNAFQQLETSGFSGSNWDFRCANSSDSQCSDSMIYSIGGKVTATSVSQQTISLNETARICPDWFSLSADDRIRTIYAAFILGRPSWIVSRFQRSNILDYADGAREIMNQSVPDPTTSSVMEHIESDNQYRSSQDESSENE